MMKDTALEHCWAWGFWTLLVRGDMEVGSSAKPVIRCSHTMAHRTLKPDGVVATFVPNGCLEHKEVTPSGGAFIRS